MDIVSFFRGIDGWVYYTILVVNTILIFAIIGYLGEKKNEQLMKLGMNTDVPNLNNGAMNLTSTKNPPQAQSGGLSIPKVAATQVVSEPQVMSNNYPNQPAISSQPLGQVPVSSPNAGINSTVNNNAIPLQNLNTNQKPIIKPEDNNIDPNEKAPAVLVINSNPNNKDVK